MTGVSASRAVAASVTAGSTSQSIATSSAASSALARLSATTATTASPCQVAVSRGSAYCGADFRPSRWVSTPTHGSWISASSRPATTAMTPGAAFAAAVSIERMRAWACGERTNAACPARALSSMSSTKVPRPSARRGALGRGTERPM